MTDGPATSDSRLRTDYHWTARQRTVLELVARGRSNLEISEELGISLAGAKWHVSEILSKLQADSRQEAADYWPKYNGWRPRFWRTFQSLAMPATLKWLTLAGAGLAAAVVAAAVVVRSVSDEQEPDPAAQIAATPTGSPTPQATEDSGLRWQFAPPSQCPVPDLGVCDTARRLRDALLAGDFAAVQQLALPVEIVCPESPDNLTSGVCSPPWAAGDRVFAFGAGKHGGGAGLQTWEQTKQFLSDVFAQAAGDSSTGPDIHIGGVGCSGGRGTAADCTDGFAVLIVVRHPSSDQLLQFAFRRAGSATGFYGVVNSVPWEPAYRSGEPYPATFGFSPDRYAVPRISFQSWSP